MRLFAPFFLLALAALPAPADPVVVVTDVGWKSTAQEEAGWNGADFDDSKWVAAVRLLGPTGNGDHYTVRNSFGLETKAGWVWSASGSDCWLRRTFEVPAGVRRAEMIYSIDDTGEVWVNGEVADVHLTSQFGQRGCGCVLDLLPWVHEGTNVLAIHGHDDGGQKGVAAEIRVDGATFLPPGPRAAVPLTPDQIEAAKDFAGRLDADDESIRAASEQALIVLARRNGRGVVDLAEQAVEKCSAEAKARVLHVKEVLYEPLWEPVGGEDARWAFAPWTPAQVREILAGNPGQQWSLLRMFVAAHVRAESDRDSILEVLSSLAADGDVERSERAVRVIGGIELTSAAGALREILKSRPKSRPGTFAAAALARIGTADDLPILEAAATCGTKPTERAAALAIRIIKSR